MTNVFAVKIVSTGEMRRLEERCAAAGLSREMLMENAGLVVAREVRDLLREVGGQRILALVGPGNNGGDGVAAARHLNEWGFKVSLYCGDRRPKGGRMDLLPEHRVPIFSSSDDRDGEALHREMAGADVVLDSLFGTGMGRPIESPYREMLLQLRQARVGSTRPVVVAVDLPSGLNGDTGAVDEVTPHADITVALGCAKSGLFAFPGADRVGKVAAVDIGIPPALTDALAVELLTDTWVRERLPARPRSGHKGTFGRLLVVSGSVNYVGAACLACSGALRVGVGLATLAAARSLHASLAGKLTEVTHLPLPEAEAGVIGAAAAEVVLQALPDYDSLLIGCGLGQHPATAEFVRAVLMHQGGPALPSMVIDADGLNILCQTPQWWRKIDERAIVTPHPGEMSRMTGMEVGEVQRDRVGVAQRWAREWGKTVVLKGAHTIVACADGRVVLSPFANPGLASAGTGDVLAGNIGGLLAQGLAPFEAAACGVYLHGRVGEAVSEKIGDMGMLASDLLGEFPPVIRGVRKVNSGGR